MAGRARKPRRAGKLFVLLRVRGRHSGRSRLPAAGRLAQGRNVDGWDTEVIAEGVRYLKVICWTYPVFGLSNSLMYALQSVETAMIGTVMSCSTICINVCLNYCLIYGNFGAPELGIVGAAVAPLVSRLVELGIILVYILFLDKKLHMKLWELLRWDGTYLQDYLKVSTPIVISGLLWGVAQAAQTAIPGHMSATAIAANSIAIILFEIFAVLGAACANTASVDRKSVV